MVFWAEQAVKPTCFERPGEASAALQHANEFGMRYILMHKRKLASHCGWLTMLADGDDRL